MTFHPDGTGGLLFDALSQEIFQLDRAAAYIWCCLAEDIAADDVAGDYAARAGISSNEAHARLGALQNTWREAGMLTRPAPHRDAALPPAPRPGRADLPRIALPSASGITSTRVLDSSVAVRFGDRDLADVCAPLLEAIRVPTPASWTAVVDVERLERGAVISTAGLAPFAVPDLRTLAPALVGHISLVALRQSMRFPAVHAAMIGTPAGAILLPGPSEYGKSTLAAGLWSSGFPVHCDDTVVLDPATLRAAPVLPWICLKSGVWPVVADFLPDLWRQPSWDRPDGKRVRYLQTAPRTHWTDPDPPAEPVRAIVFARFDPGKETEWRRLSTAEALGRLLPSLDPIGRVLEPEDIGRIVAWVEATPCYHLSHASLAGGVAAVTEIVS